MDELLRILRDQPQRHSLAESTWLDILARGEEENLLPWLTARLGSDPVQMPPRITAMVAEVRREAQQKAFAWSAALKQLLAMFHERGLKVISLKGPWLGERIYGDAALRSYSDLDFLVKPSDWNAVEDLLRDLGYSPRGPANDLNREWERGWVHLEPHFRLENPYDFTWDLEQVWARAQLSEFHGVPGWLLAPEDEVAYLSTHAVSHCFERLSLLLDLRTAFREIPLPDELPFPNEASELQNAIVISRILAERLENSRPFDRNVLPKWTGPRPHLERVAERVWQRFMLRRASSDWRTARRFLIELQSPGWRTFVRRLRYLRALIRIGFSRVGCLTEPDFSFAARFHIRKRWQVRMLRPIRVLIADSCKSIYG
jgi:hypothetical protein